MSSLRIFLFGGFRLVHSDENKITSIPRSGQLLLAYLLMQPHRGYPREILAELFWGDRDPSSSRRCLNTAVWRLRQVLEPQDIPRGTYLLTDNASDQVSFNWDSDHWLDMVAFEAHAVRVVDKPVEIMDPSDVHVLEQALRFYTGELLEGFYDDWALRERERQRRLYLNSLAHLMHYYQHHEYYEKGLDYGQQILDQDPLRERIHRQMMRLYVSNGQRSLAIRQYKRCCQILREELDIEPMPETQALYSQLIEGGLPHTFSSRANCSVNAHQVLEHLHIAQGELERARQELQHAFHLIEQISALH